MKDKNINIVLVDDSRATLSLIREELSDLGYRIHTASSVKEGLSLIERIMPDCVVTDYNMPQQTGVDLCRQLKADKDLRHIPIIMLTSKESVEHIVESYQAGADDFISKGLATSMIILKAKIDAILRIKRLEADLIELRQLEALRQLILTYNHRFNNPLAILYGLVHQLKTGGITNTQEAYGKIKDQLDRLKNLIEEISQLKKYESTDYIGQEKMVKVASND